jgi:hypothetical protein
MVFFLPAFSPSAPGKIIFTLTSTKHKQIKSCSDQRDGHLNSSRQLRYPEQIDQKFMEMLPSALPRKPRREESRGNRCRGLKNSGRTSSARPPPHPFLAWSGRFQRFASGLSPQTLPRSISSSYPNKRIPRPHTGGRWAGGAQQPDIGRRGGGTPVRDRELSRCGGGGGRGGSAEVTNFFWRTQGRTGRLFWRTKSLNGFFWRTTVFKPSRPQAVLLVEILEMVGIRVLYELVLVCSMGGGKIQRLTTDEGIRTGFFLTTKHTNCSIGVFLTYQILILVFLPTTVLWPSRPQAVLLVEILQ